MTLPHAVAPADYEELRIALVMNGGVSLAVWIGGVSHEINRAVRGTDENRTPLEYRALLDLTATTARVDVISGASAGGLNGALLALAMAYDTDLLPLRGVWLTKGSLDRLLRSPYDADPSSLLRGNDRFLDDLRAAFSDLQRSGVLTSASSVPIDLTLTASLLHGEPNRISDDLGTVISDVRHQGRLQFSRGENHDTDPFADAQIAGRLALAARASASFPVAFEPTFCPVSPKDPLDDARFLDMKGIASFDKSRFLLDGGILDNKPLESALAAVFRQRTNREVRRVLAYVEPAPGHTAVDHADDIKDAPTLGRVALASLVELPRVESISAQLEDIIEHNRQVRRKRQTRVVLIKELKAAGLQTLATQLWSVYRKRRGDSAADYIVEVLAAALASKPDATITLGRRRREWLSRLISERPLVPWVPLTLPAADTGRDDLHIDAWTWGLFTVEHIAEIVIDLLRRALIAAPLAETALRARLKEHYAAAYDLMIATPRTRRQDVGFWQGRADDLAKAMNPSQPDMVEQTRAWADESMHKSSERKVTVTATARAKAQLPRALPSGPILINEALGWIAESMAAVVAAAAGDVQRAAEAGVAGGRTADDREFARDLAAYVEYLAPADRRAAHQVLVRLLTLEVVQYATGSYREGPDQFVELVQFSANGQSVLGGPAEASQKLAGAQLGNFGGFYKRAWRANDWLFGRMDGSDRLVRILLNPARLARLYPNQSEAVVRALRDIAVTPGAAAGLRTFLEQRWQHQEPHIREELSFLDRPELPVPEQLPTSVNAVLVPMHLRMLREELPEIAGAAEADRKAGAGDRDASAAFVAAANRLIGTGGATAWRDLPPGDLIRLFTESGVAQERFAGEVGTDLFTSTLTQTLAVAATTVSGSHAGLGALGRVLQVIRIPILMLDAVAQTAVRQSRTAAFISGCALSLGATIVAVSFFAPGSLAPNVIRLGSLLFVAAVLVALRRHPRLAGAWILLALAAWLVRSGPPPFLRELWEKFVH